MSKKREHAIDFAIYASDWYAGYDKDTGEYLYRNAPVGFAPTSGDLIKLTVDQLYERFIKEVKP
jgi:hypothetical protein